MHIFIATIGTRGDVQPYVALGKGLRSAGHSVTICTSSYFETCITENGLKYGYMSNDLLDLLDTAEGRNAIEDASGIFGMVKTGVALMQKSKIFYKRLLQETWQAAQHAAPDIILFHPKSLSGVHIAEKLGIPALMAVPVPLIVPTDAFPLIGVPALPLGGWYHRLSYKLVQAGYRNYDGIINEFRRDLLGLKEVRNSAMIRQTADGQPLPILHHLSPHVVPRPHDWPETAFMSGYWFLDEASDWQPSAALQTFLEAGAPPVYVGFGSMAGRHPQRLTRIVVEALQRAGVRGIIATGWGGLQASDLPDSIFVIDTVPHDWLFPRVSAVVHHGGAGTTAAGLRAGRPTVICPFIADQPFWGQRVHALGVGSAPIPHKQLSAEKLAQAIHEVTANPTIQHNASALGDALRREDGVANAIAIIERTLMMA